MREVHDREEHRSQEERVPLPRGPLGDPPVGEGDPARAEAVRLDRPARVDGLRERPRDRRVSGGLRAVRRGRPLEVPPAPHDQQRRGDQQGERERRRGDGEPADQQTGPDHADGELWDGLAHRIGQPVDVRGDTGQQVAGPGPLQDSRRQPDRPYEEVLAQVRQHLLAQHRAAQPHHPYEEGLDDEGEREQGDGALQMEAARPLGEAFDERAEQVRAHHRGGHRDRVDADEQRERHAVTAQQIAYVGAHGPGRAHGQGRRRRRGRRVVRRWRQADHADSPSSSDASFDASLSSLARASLTWSSLALSSRACSSSVSRVTTAR